MRYLQNYTHTIYASYLGYITQAIVNNLAPLLFLTFSESFSLTLDKITLITTVNFAVQLLVDLLATRYADKIGYRRLVVAGDVGCSAGPTVVGLVANANGGSLQNGLICAIVFPVMIFCGIRALRW